eukprot:gnl/TRDRNA2_/TRDRNA2_156500_c0_seq1.p1 gnl/TRDRNA2_/TRDRNA2_156500_c0~~gnl/TRDRNA2_/TRDRNA2_156500_c0_seq1.p1  ORF type:complete len:764 (+),score=128.89 gnl/TRDRNA2_/TRDRNA2_156500_c0_seq1:264-2294(+)
MPPTAIGFDGVWRPGDGGQILVQGTTVTMSSGEMLELKVLGPDTCTLDVKDGGVFTGRLLGNRVEWSDGDVWERVRVDAGEQTPLANLFRSADADGDGFLSEAEFKRAAHEMELLKQEMAEEIRMKDAAAQLAKVTAANAQKAGQRAGQRARSVISIGDLCQSTKGVMRSTSRKRMAWDWLGVALLGYDFVVIPLQVFELPYHPILVAMTWALPAFWGVDLFLNFRTSFEDGGTDERRQGRVARQYMKSRWFRFDVFMLLLDVAQLLVFTLALVVPNIDGRFHLVRSLRLLRVLRVRDRLARMMTRIQSESFKLALGIVKLVVLLLLLSHVIACGFYGIGTLDVEGWDESWVQQRLNGRDLAYRYLTSLHWSMAQFTLASVDVGPGNSAERVYAVCTLFLALWCFSWLLSALSQARTQLFNLDMTRHEQSAALQRYLSEHRVAAPLRSRIWSWLERNHTVKPTGCFHEKDVDMLLCLPSRLRAEVRDHIFRPVITKHPFFQHLNGADPSAMQRLYHCVQEFSLFIGQELFARGEAADQMYFVMEGSLRYGTGYGSTDSRLKRQATSGIAAEPPEVAAGQWLCEPPLWIEWTHRGRAIAANHCELLGLNALQFQELMRQGAFVAQAVRYAKAYAEHAKEHWEQLTDLCAEPGEIRDLSERSFSAEPAAGASGGVAAS